MKIISTFLTELKEKPQKELNKFLFIFYCVGIIGFLLPFSRKFFIFLTPYALILNIFLILFFHKTEKKIDFLVFILIFVLGFFIEAIGVNTGKIFGHYYYGKGLGLKIFETPILIGINWLFLSYSFFVLYSKTKLNIFLNILLASVSMVFYDFILEMIAPQMNMWFWKNEIIPLKNYIAWFIISLVFQIILVTNKTQNNNRIAIVLLSCQFIFFIVLTIFFKFFV